MPDWKTLRDKEIACIHNHSPKINARLQKIESEDSRESLHAALLIVRRALQDHGTCTTRRDEEKEEPLGDEHLVADLLISQRNLVIEGVAGIGKTYIISSLCKRLPSAFNPMIGEEVASLQTELDNLVQIDQHAATTDWGSQAKQTVKKGLELMAQGTVIPHLVVLHPGSSYDELIIGLRPRPDTDGAPFGYRAGSILKAILAAQEAFGRTDCAALHLLVLDEMNRCNLPSVLGELMLLIDPSRRLSRKEFEMFGQLRESDHEENCIREGKAVRLPNLDRLEGKERKSDLLWIPENLLMLGTMNSSDRSILGFDQALRRRFPPHRLDPHTVQKWMDVLTRKHKSEEVTPDTLNIAASEITALAAVNVLLRARIGPDAMIGHSYIYDALAECGSSADEKTTKDAFARAWEFGILPQVIHAAESARELEFVEQMMKPTDKKPHPVLDNQSAQYADSTGNSDRLGECIAAIYGEKPKGLNGFGEAMSSGAIGASQSCKRTLTLVGRGHGKRLLIVGRTNTPSDEDKAKWLQVFDLNTDNLLGSRDG